MCGEGRCQQLVGKQDCNNRECLQRKPAERVRESYTVQVKASCGHTLRRLYSGPEGSEGDDRKFQ
jgi:hypothetical protein